MEGVYRCWGQGLSQSVAEPPASVLHTVGPTRVLRTPNSSPDSPVFVLAMLQCNSSSTVASGKYKGACLSVVIQYDLVQGQQADTKVGGAGERHRAAADWMVPGCGGGTG